MDTIPPVEDTGTRLIPPEERDYSQSPVASGGPQASQIPEFQGMPPPRHGCPAGSSEDCCPDKEKCRRTWKRGVRDAQPADAVKLLLRGHSELQQPKHGVFNERVSVDLIGPLHRLNVETSILS